METKIYNLKGKEAGSVKLPESIFGLPWNADLVHQVITSMQSSARTPVAHVKTRGEVRGGGKKPWKQKGTGRARHGSTRSPIWVGGGVAHGPRKDKNYDRKVSKKMKTKAFLTILSRKYKNGEVFFVDSLSMSTPKTKDAVATIKALGAVKGLEKITYKKNAAIFGLPNVNEATKKSFRNIGSVSVENVKEWNPLSLMQYRYAVIVSPEDTIKTLEAKLTKEAAK